MQCIWGDLRISLQTISHGTLTAGVTHTLRLTALEHPSEVVSLLFPIYIEQIETQRTMALSVVNSGS